jgi:hypothetical protein
VGAGDGVSVGVAVDIAVRVCTGDGASAGVAVGGAVGVELGLKVTTSTTVVAMGSGELQAVSTARRSSGNHRSRTLLIRFNIDTFSAIFCGGTRLL